MDIVDASPASSGVPNQSDLSKNQKGSLLPTMTAGFIVGLMEVIIAVSLAALVFSGDLSVFLANGIGLALLGAIISGLLVALLTSLPGVVGGIQETPAAITAVIAAVISSNLPDSATADEKFLTVVAAVSLTTLCTGAFFYLLGSLKLGNLIRYLPYPVVGGFLAGTGWLLVTGGIAMMVGEPFVLSKSLVYFHFEYLIRWLPGLILAVLLYLLLQRYDHYLVLPGVVFGGAAVFYIFISATGMSIGEASASGWLLGPFPPGSLWRPLAIRELAEVDWSLIYKQVGNINAIVMISVISLLMNASGIELAIEENINLDNELRAAGLSNVVAGLFAGFVNYQQLGLSIFNQNLGIKNRLVGVFGVMLCGVVLVLGARVLSIFPKAVLGGLLLYLGITFLVEWVLKAWRKVPAGEYAIILLILILVASVGFLEGIGVGILAAVILFVINYSRIEVVKHSYSGAVFRSTVTRSKNQRRLLNDVGRKVVIFELQGVIFFGTANNLLNEVRGLRSRPNLPPPAFIVFDFSQVSGLDTSALLSFQKMRQIGEIGEFKIVCADLSPELFTQFEQIGLMKGLDRPFLVFPDLDHAVEWCEDQLLQSLEGGAIEPLGSLESRLAEDISDSGVSRQIMAYMEKLELPAGHRLIAQGAHPDALYFIEEGQITAQLETADKRPVRLQTMIGENVVGEVGLYLGINRTASVVTDKPTILYKLSAQALSQMERDHPEVALYFHKFLAQNMAERLVHLTQTVSALSG